VILKFFELDARFPRHGGEVPSAAVLRAPLAPHRRCPGGRRGHGPVLGSVDEDKLAEWMADEVCPVESGEDRLRAALLARCRAGGLEPPGPSRVRRVIGTAQAGLEQRFTTAITSRLAPYVAARLEELVVRDGPEPPDDERPDSETGNDGEAVVGGGPALLAELKSDPSRLGLETVLVEVGKLGRVRALGLPADLPLLARPQGPEVADKRAPYAEIESNQNLEDRCVAAVGHDQDRIGMPPDSGIGDHQLLVPGGDGVGMLALLLLGDLLTISPHSPQELGRDPQTHPAGPELLAELHQVQHRPPEAVEAGDDQDVAVAQVAQQGVELRPGRLRAGDLVDVDVAGRDCWVGQDRRCSGGVAGSTGRSEFLVRGGRGCAQRVSRVGPGGR